MAQKEQKKYSDQLQFFLNESKELNCPICFQFYDSKSKTPMMFCSRQHNLCGLCSTNLLKQSGPKCPICSIKIVKKNVTKNRLLVQMVEKLGQLKPLKYQQKKQQDILMIKGPNSQKQLPKASISFLAPTQEQVPIFIRRNRYNAQPFFDDQQESEQSEESYNDWDSSQNQLSQSEQSQESAVSQDEEKNQQEDFQVQHLQKPRKIRKI